jgi:copper chaperone CopZ
MSVSKWGLESMKRSVILAVLAVGLSAGCDKETLSSPPVAPVAFNGVGAPTVAFNVPDMMCVDSCAVAVKEILARQPGVKEVVVDFDAKTATVAVEEGEFDAQQALAALVDKRFDNSSLKQPVATMPEADVP